MLKFFNRSGSLKEEKDAPLPTEPLPFPSLPQYRIAVIVNSNRYDSTLLANGVVRAATTQGGAACHVLVYDHRDHQSFSTRLSNANYDCIVNRASNAGFAVRNGNEQDHNFVSPYECRKRYEEMMRKQMAMGKLIWPTPNLSTALGDRNVIVRLKLIEMCDGHVESHTVSEFIQFCCYGRRSAGAGGGWKTQCRGSYFEGGSGMVDSRLLHEAGNESVCLTLIGGSVIKVEHSQVPAEKRKRVQTRSIQGFQWRSPGEFETREWMSNESHAFKPLVEMFSNIIQSISNPTRPTVDTQGSTSLQAKFEKAALGIGGDAGGIRGLTGTFPLLWTAHFLPCQEGLGGGLGWTLSKIKCDCINIGNFDAGSKGKSLKDVSAEELQVGYQVADRMGQVVMNELARASSVVFDNVEVVGSSNNHHKVRQSDSFSTVDTTHDFQHETESSDVQEKPDSDRQLSPSDETHHGENDKLLDMRRYQDFDDFEMSKILPQSSFLQSFSDISFDLFQTSNGFEVKHTHHDLAIFHTAESTSSEFAASPRSLLDKELRTSPMKLLNRVVQFTLRPDAVTLPSSNTPSVSSQLHEQISTQKQGFNRVKQTVWVLAPHVRILRAHTELPITAVPVVAYVYVARWPAAGALHFDFELEHSEEEMQMQSVALAEGNELYSQGYKTQVVSLPSTVVLHEEEVSDEEQEDEKESVNSIDINNHSVQERKLLEEKLGIKFRRTLERSDSEDGGKQLPCVGFTNTIGTAHFRDQEFVTCVPVLIGRFPTPESPFALTNLDEKRAVERYHDSISEKRKTSEVDQRSEEQDKLFVHFDNPRPRAVIGDYMTSTLSLAKMPPVPIPTPKPPELRSLSSLDEALEAMEMDSDEDVDVDTSMLLEQTSKVTAITMNQAPLLGRKSSFMNNGVNKQETQEEEVEAYLRLSRRADADAMALKAEACAIEDEMLVVHKQINEVDEMMEMLSAPDQTLTDMLNELEIKLEDLENQFDELHEAAETAEEVSVKAIQDSNETALRFQQEEEHERLRIKKLKQMERKKEVLEKRASLLHEREMLRMEREKALEQYEQQLILSNGKQVVAFLSEEFEVISNLAQNLYVTTDGSESISTRERSAVQACPNVAFIVLTRCDLSHSSQQEQDRIQRLRKQAFTTRSGSVKQNQGIVSEAASHKSAKDILLQEEDKSTVSNTSLVVDIAVDYLDVSCSQEGFQQTTEELRAHRVYRTVNFDENQSEVCVQIPIPKKYMEKIQEYVNVTDIESHPNVEIIRVHICRAHIYRPAEPVSRRPSKVSQTSHQVRSIETKEDVLSKLNGKTLESESTSDGTVIIGAVNTCSVQLFNHISRGLEGRERQTMIPSERNLTHASIREKNWGDVSVAQDDSIKIDEKMEKASEYDNGSHQQEHDLEDSHVEVDTPRVEGKYNRFTPQDTDHSFADSERRSDSESRLEDQSSIAGVDAPQGVANHREVGEPQVDSGQLHAKQRELEDMEKLIADAKEQYVKLVLQANESRL